MQSADVLIQEEIQTRVRLYDFSTGSQTFFQWQAGMLPAQDGITVLELGGGNGALWPALLPRWPNVRLTLTDIDAEVLNAASDTLAPLTDQAESIAYEAVDFNDLGFAENQFDVVIANHNLYYAENLDHVLGEIHRVLKPTGQLICSTIGKDHLHELIALMRSQGAEFTWGAEQWAENFGLENGATRLLGHFEHVDQFEYDNNLHVSSTEPVLAYLKKAMKGRLNDWVCKNADAIQVALENQMAERGYLRLTPHSGFFIAYKA